MTKNRSFAFRAWIMAGRPKTLPAALAPVITGSAAAYSYGFFRPLPALAALLGALLLQIAVNLANDYFDYVKGVDTKERIGPRRAAASGDISLPQLRAGIAMVLGLVVLVGVYLVARGGWPILLIGIAAILSALAYSGGPLPLASHALGELFVFLFFGIIAVCGTFYVQALALTPLVFLLSLPAASLITAILVVNNYRDLDTDRAAGKTTLAVLLGKTATRIEYVILLLAAYCVPLVLLFLRGQLSALLPLLSLPLTVPLLRVMFSREADGKALNQTLAGTAGLSLLFNLLLSLYLILP